MVKLSDALLTCYAMAEYSDVVFIIAYNGGSERYELRIGDVICNYATLEEAVRDAYCALTKP